MLDDEEIETLAKVVATTGATFQWASSIMGGTHAQSLVFIQMASFDALTIVRYAAANAGPDGRPLTSILQQFRDRPEIETLWTVVERRLSRGEPHPVPPVPPEFPFQVLITYAMENEADQQRLVKHLAPLRNERWIEFTPHCCINEDWADRFRGSLGNAEVVLLLLTPDLIASEFGRAVDVPSHMKSYIAGGGVVIGVLVDDCEWQSIGPWLSAATVLPAGHLPVNLLPHPSSAWTRLGRDLRSRLACLARMPRLLSLTTGVGPHIESLARPPARQGLALATLLKQLPGEAERIFGREEELDWLDAAFSDPTVGVASLVAYGGVGKSALVYRWLNRRFAHDNTVRFLGHSFYSQGTQNQVAPADQWILESLRELGDPQPELGSSAVRGQRLAKLIGKGRTLLILDGLEPIQYGPGHPAQGNIRDPGILALLKGLAEARGHLLCVVTSRLELTDPALQTSGLKQRKLELLPAPAAKELLRFRGVTGSDAALDEATEYLARHALALVLAAEYVKTFHRGDVSAIKNFDLEQVRQGRHAMSVMAAHETAIRRDGDPLDLDLLGLLGLFDRPIQWPWFRALAAAPAIPGLTEVLVNSNDQEVWESISRLRQWGLMFDSGPEETRVLDAHPLVREYFGDRLTTEKPVAWREAHSRLFKHLTDSADRLPETLDTMEPLLMAIVHGCKAARHRDALHDVYLPRVMRGEAFFAANNLGATGTLLSVLSHFFESGDGTCNWSAPIRPAPPEIQGWTMPIS